MEAYVNDNCAGCSLCISLCPEGLKMVNGKAVVKNKEAKCLKEAAKSCPVNAIIIKE